MDQHQSRFKCSIVVGSHTGAMRRFSLSMAYHRCRHTDTVSVFLDRQSLFHRNLGYNNGGDARYDSSRSSRLQVPLNYRTRQHDRARFMSLSRAALRSLVWWDTCPWRIVRAAKPKTGGLLVNSSTCSQRRVPVQSSVHISDIH